MVALSSFGNCQPLLVLNHLNGTPLPSTHFRLARATSTHPKGGGASLEVPPKRVPGRKEVEGDIVYATSASERGSSLSLRSLKGTGSLGGLDITHPRKADTRKLSDLVRTLDRVTATARTKS